MTEAILNQLFKDFPIGDVLDLGAGNGHQAFFAAEQGARVIAVDQKAIPESCKGNSNITWAQSLIHLYAMPQDAFDLVIMRNVLHFLKREYVMKVFAQQVVRSLRPGGHLFLATFDKQDIVFEKSVLGYYTDEEIQSLFYPLVFQEPVREVIHDDHPPYGKHVHNCVKYIGSKLNE